MKFLTWRYRIPVRLSSIMMAAECVSKSRPPGVPLTHIWEATGRQAHCGRTHEYADHYPEPWMGLVHVLADLPDERQENDSRNGVADKRGSYQNDGCKHKGHTIETHAADA